jgi:hypothetical protein
MRKVEDNMEQLMWLSAYSDDVNSLAKIKYRKELDWTDFTSLGKRWSWCKGHETELHYEYVTKWKLETMSRQDIPC